MKILKLAIAEVIYGIWRARNELILNQTQLDSNLRTEIVQLVIVRCQLDRKLLPFVLSC